MTDTAALHAQQMAFWNGAGAARWVERQARMDATIAAVSDAAIGVAGLRQGEKVLDVGCGCGATILALADAVGPGGHVSGIDISAPMLEVARQRTAGRAGIDCLLADAATHPFAPASFDLVFSRFGVMFFPDPVAAFANLRRAIRPGGRLTFASWRAFDENLWMKVPLAVATTLVPPPPPPGPDEPGPLAFADPARVTRILVAAGFEAPVFTRFDLPMRLGDNLDDASDQAMTIGPASRALLDQPDDVRQAVRTAIRAALAPYAGADGVDLQGAVWLVRAGSA
ncbi:MAG: class I SAM-dependent methyltransferase [Rhodospirillales bacterium]|nr:class I SAM-dependent methyltransferase [Rhodospirillales bacterium]